MSFLSLVRITQLDDLLATDTYDTVTQSYFRNFATLQETQSDLPATVSDFVQLLQDAGVVSSPQGSLLLQNDQEGRPSQRYPLIRSALLAVNNSDTKLYAKRMSELNYLANVLVSGCSYLDRAFRPGEAAEAALATCNLGIEYVLSKDSKTGAKAVLAQVLITNNVIKMFRIGWLILFQDVSLHTAKSLSKVLPDVPIENSWLKKMIANTIATLKAGIVKGTPWDARESIDVLESVFDQPTVYAIKQLLNECPSVTSAVLKREASNSTGDDEFISGLTQIEQIHRFLSAEETWESDQRK
jgi:hypothetical protein